MNHLIPHFDPVVAESVSNYKLTLRLHLILENGLRFIRDYYDVEMSNGDLLIYLTTDELDANFEVSKYNEEFSFYFSHQHAIEALRINETLNIYANRIMHSIKNINSIIYYEPEVMSLDFKQVIQNELIDQIEGYTETDFEMSTLNHIKKWKNLLDHYRF